MAIGLTSKSTSAAALQRAPCSNPSLPRTLDVGIEIGMLAVNLVQRNDRPYPGAGLENKFDLGVPTVRQGIRPGWLFVTTESPEAVGSAPFHRSGLPMQARVVAYLSWFSAGARRPS